MKDSDCCVLKDKVRNWDKYTCHELIYTLTSGFHDDDILNVIRSGKSLKERSLLDLVRQVVSKNYLHTSDT